MIRGTEFKIMKFTEKKERNQYGMKMDVSELLLEHQQNHAQLTLVKGQIATSPQSVATFVYTWGGRKEFEVRKDQEFPLATAEGNRTYKLIDVRPGQGRNRKYAKSPVRRSRSASWLRNYAADSIRKAGTQESRKGFPR